MYTGCKFTWFPSNFWLFCCRFDDGMVEVFALYSSFHIAQLQVGLAEPLRIGQGRSVKVRNLF